MPEPSNPFSAEYQARMIAPFLAKGKMPGKMDDLEIYLNFDPREVLVTLDGFVDHIASEKKQDQHLAAAYLFLMSHQLERIRYQVDRGFPWARELVEEFQHAVAGMVTEGRIDGSGLTSIAGALHEAKLPASQELLDASAVLAEAEEEGEVSIEALADMILAMVRECRHDPFLVHSTLAETGHAMPPEGRALFAGVMAGSSSAVAREASVLFLLSGDAVVRETATAALDAHAGKISPASLRRMISVRNWLPVEDRPRLDGIVQAARSKRVECAAWDRAAAPQVFATVPDGSGAHGFLMATPAGRKKKIVSSVLLRRQVGVLDAWITPARPDREAREMLSHAFEATASIEVPRSHLDRAVRHHLAVHAGLGTMPPAGLLQVAETLGSADWQPELLDWRAELDGLLGLLPEGAADPSAIRTTLASSDEWGDPDGIAGSWFEDDEEVSRLMSRKRRGGLDKTADYLLGTVFERRRAKWAEHFLWTALWMKAATEANIRMPWEEFAVLARAVDSGHDLTAIPLMANIATRTSFVAGGLVYR